MNPCRHLPSRREALIGSGALFAWTQMPKLAEHFDSIDLNRDGKLSRDELRAGRQALREKAH